MRRSQCLALLVLGLSSIWACSRGGVAGPRRSLEVGVDLGAGKLVPDCPLEMTYRFKLLPEEEVLSHEYVVYVHFIDPDGTIQFTDDHEPPVPTTDWAPGQEVGYSRMFFGPRVLWDGALEVEVGLYRPDTGEKLGIGKSGGENSMAVGKLMLVPPKTDSVFYGRGFYEAERSTTDRDQLWRWTEVTANATAANPGQDSVLHLALSGESRAHSDPLGLRVEVNGEEVSRLEVKGGGRQAFSLPVTAEHLGQGDTVSIGLQAERTFVPAQLGLGDDDRVLGVRVFHLCLESGQ